MWSPGRRAASESQLGTPYRYRPLAARLRDLALLKPLVPDLLDIDPGNNELAVKCDAQRANSQSLRFLIAAVSPLVSCSEAASALLKRKRLKATVWSFLKGLTPVSFGLRSVSCPLTKPSRPILTASSNPPNQKRRQAILCCSAGDSSGKRRSRRLGGLPSLRNVGAQEPASVGCPGNGRACAHE